MTARPRPRLRASLRPRLALAFVLIAGVSTGLLAAGSYGVVSQQRHEDALERAMEQVQFKFAIARLHLSSPPLEEEIEDLISLYREHGRFRVVLELEDRTYQSDPGITESDVPVEVGRKVELGNTAHQRMGLDGEPYLVLGGVPPDTEARVYLFKSEQRLERELGQLRAVLLGGWILLVLVAVLVGHWLARRTLRPVGEASAAARDLAAGLLGTRLPVARQDEFGAWAESFNQMAGALAAKIAELEAARERERRFSADVSHELRTPLSAVAAEASLLERERQDMPASARHTVELLVRDVARMRTLVEELTEIYLADEGKTGVSPQPVEVGELVRHAVASRGWGQLVHIDGGPVALTTDPHRLERVVVNLIDNALEHGGGKAWVDVREGEEEAIIEVTDRGPGIPQQDLPRLFERFYKGDPARTRGGSGLGLAIARENAALLGGRIEVRTREGAGATFVFTLPRVGVRAGG
jgi:signal transduction histidine kinase